MKYRVELIYFFSILLLNQFLISNLQSQSFYPLQIGNRWDYKEQGWYTWPPFSNAHSDSFSVLIEKDTTIENKKYYILNHTDRSGGQILRFESNSVYYYISRFYNKEYAYFRFDSNIYDIWHTKPGLDISYRLYDTVILFNRKTEIRKYYLYSIVLNQVYLSDFFGPYRLESDGEPPGTSKLYIDLVGCIIGGKTYGKLLDIKKNKDYSSEYILYQNYPNPFNPNTQIDFYLPRSSFVSLKIYNILGQELEVLLNEKRNSGNHSITWNANKYPSGVYFYKLIVNQVDLNGKDNYVISKKLIISK
jgi:hypothetical protein